MKSSYRLCFLSLIIASLSACTMGPDFQKPNPQTPINWQSQRNGIPLELPKISNQTLSANWWQALNDPVLNELETKALANSPNLQITALHFVQARVERLGTSAQYGPNINLSGSLSRQRVSENGSATRTFGALGNGGLFNKNDLIQYLAKPYHLYQTGFDASWEPDLWGRIRRSVEAADAQVAQQGALFDLQRLSLVSDVAQQYIELRQTQAQITLTKQDIAILSEQSQLLAARARQGLNNHISLAQQQSQLASLNAQLPALQAKANAHIGALTVLLGEPAGALNNLLAPTAAAINSKNLPDLALGLPSEVARRRPDILAAEAALHAATANIGVAKAALYPSIRLGASFGSEATSGQKFGEWGSRTWQVGPSFDLPIFDHGRRMSVVRLRELQQQEAAINYQQTVLKAWQEIDNSLNRYAAAQMQANKMRQSQAEAEQAARLIKSRYQHGVSDFNQYFNAQHAAIDAANANIQAQAAAFLQYININKAIGNVPN